jgi:16S rRNA (cytidine1402-2'-O)-methyltransferase
VELPYLMVFYEAPHRILECVADMQNVFGGQRRIVMAREITKLYESIHACMLGQALEWLNADANNQRGEFVLLVSGAEEDAAGKKAETMRILTVLLQELPLKQAVQLAVTITGAHRNELYQAALSIKQNGAP